MSPRDLGYGADDPDERIGDHLDEAAIVRLARIRYEEEARLVARLGQSERDPVALYLDAYQQLARRGGRPARNRKGSLRQAMPTGDATPQPATLRPVARRPRSRALAVSAALVLLLASGAAFAHVWRASGTILTAAERNLRCGETTVLTVGDRIVAAIPVESCDGRPHLTAPFADSALTADLATKIGLIEGEWRVGRTLFGQDVLGPVRWSASQLRLIGGGRGASSPIQSAFETLAGAPNSLAADPFKKLALVVAGARFTARHLPDDAARAKFLTERMSIVVGGGVPRAGRLGAAALFGGRAPETLAERCIFARAAGFPVIQPAPKRRLSDDVAARWARAIGPSTARCVALTPATDEERTAAMEHLRRLCGDSDICVTPGVVADPKARRAALREAAARGMPQFRQPPAAPRHVAPAIIDALRLAGLDGAGTVEMTLDPAAQTALGGAVAGQLSALTRRLPAGTGAVDPLVAVAEIANGRLELRAAYAPRHGALWGPVARRGEAWVLLPPAVGQASTQKIPLVLLGASRGAEGLREATARSDTPWFTKLARALPPEVDALQRALGFFGEPTPDAAIGSAMGFGRLATPAQMMGIIAAIIAPTSGPVNSLTPFAAESLAPPIDLASLGFDDATRAAATEVLRAPLEPGGTLHALARRVAAPGCAAVAGKSGTHTTEGVNRSRIALIAYRCGDRLLVVHASVSAPLTGPGLGALAHADLAPLVEAALVAVTTRASERSRVPTSRPSR